MRRVLVQVLLLIVSLVGVPAAAAPALSLPIRLQVLKVNARAISFHVRLGFVQTDSTDSHVLMEWVP